MAAALLVAWKDLRLRVRDRSFFIIGLIAPLALAFVFNLTFSPAFEGPSLGLRFGLVDQDGSSVSASLRQALDGLAADGVITFEPYAGPSTADDAIDSGTIDAYFLIRPDFGAAVESGASPALEVVGGVDSPTSTAVAASIARQFASGIDAARLAVFTTALIRDEPVTPEFAGSLGNDPASAAFTFRLADLFAETRQLDPATYIAAGMAVFFMFFTVQSGVLGLLDEMREGTLPRLFAAPVSRWSVLAGKGLVSLLLGLISMSVLMVATRVLMGASWGHPAGVGLLLLGGVGAAVALMGVVAGFARSPEGAENLASIAAVVLGMLGGVFFPIGDGEGLLSSLTLMTPHAWFLRGLGELAGGAHWTAALPAAGVLAGMALALGTVAWWALGRRFAR